MARHLRRWHRWTGVLIFIVVAVIAVTGILLNHTEDLALDQRSIGHPAVVALYGLDREPAAQWLATGGHQLVHVGSLLYVDGKPVADLVEPLVGAAAAGAGIVAASSERLLLIDRDARLIEALGASLGLPTPIEALGTTDDGRPAFRADGRTYVLEPESLDWTPSDMPLANPSRIHPGVPREFSGELPEAAISLEHLLLDLHTGRVLGRLGPWLADLAALGLCFLAASGILMALRRRP